MYKINIAVVLFILESVLVCDTLIVNEYGQPVATSYATREDGLGSGKNFGYGFSKKSGYNKMIVTTYLTPVPEEVSASYSTYIIHPVDKERCGYNTLDAKPVSETSQTFPEEGAKVPSFFQMFPIVVEDTEEQSNNKYDQVIPRDDTKVDDEGNNINKRWFFNEQPKVQMSVINDNKEWLDGWKEEPKSNTEEYWKKFKKEFDDFYEDEFQKFFGDENKDDDEDEDYNDYDKDDQDDDDYYDNDDYYDWIDKIPYQYLSKYQYEDNKNDYDKWNPNNVYEPQYGFGQNYDINNDHYGYERLHKL